MGVDFRPIGDGFAREVVGLRLWNEIKGPDLDAVRDAWAKCGVLVFRRQALSEDELVDWSALFGVPQIVHRTDWVSPEKPEVIHVSNLQYDTGKHIGMPGNDDVDWHTDQSYTKVPATGAMLYAVEVPPHGGSTYWANMQMAYDALPRDLRATLDGKRGIFSYAKRLAGYDERARRMSEEARRKTPDVVHPLVNRHPVTGRLSLYLDLTTLIGIEGMSAAESDALIERLRELVTKPEFVYRHLWQVGDVVMWDNGFLMHSRDEYDAAGRRFLKRTTMALPSERHIHLHGEMASR